MNYNSKTKSSDFAWIPSILSNMSNRILNLSPWYLFNLIVFLVPALKQSKSKSWRSPCRGGIGKGETVGQIKIVHHICSPKKREVHCQTYLLMIYDGILWYIWCWSHFTTSLRGRDKTQAHIKLWILQHNLKLLTNDSPWTPSNCLGCYSFWNLNVCIRVAYGMKWNRHHDVLQKN